MLSFHVSTTIVLLVGAQKNAWLKRHVLKGEKSLTLTGEVTATTELQTLFEVTENGENVMRVDVQRNSADENRLKGMSVLESC